MALSVDLCATFVTGDRCLLYRVMPGWLPDGAVCHLPRCPLFQEIAGLGGDTNYVKHETEMQWNQPLFWGCVRPIPHPTPPTPPTRPLPHRNPLSSTQTHRESGRYRCLLKAFSQYCNRKKCYDETKKCHNYRIVFFANSHLNDLSFQYIFYHLL